MNKFRATASALALTAVLSISGAAMAETTAYRQPAPAATMTPATAPGRMVNDVGQMTGNVVNDVTQGTRNMVNDVRTGTTNMMNPGVTPHPSGMRPYNTGVTPYNTAPQQGVTPYGTTGNYGVRPYNTNMNNRNVRAATDNRRFDWGWLGLLGLLGLAGMGNRNRERNR